MLQNHKHSSVCLEDFVPQKHLYRQLEAKFDLSFLRALVAEHYSPYGRPSIDPVVFFKLQLLMFFEDIRSERQLMEVVNLNLAHRLNEKIGKKSFILLLQCKAE